ncbi:invasion associated locus B family protein [Pseudochelatococcus contaminans]|uniref:Invasion protein IalB n=1 Tax=Pseudochelatococcus contaminans TaxID=1538103 RepID=A0A7W5Z440_9HYPH|nr:invasion associated locus B family protein [Pseudochelatococcus contaminans]MBB3809236.1 invasion protein IalB [Pseudochelatococcus contaminans]
MNDLVKTLTAGAAAVVAFAGGLLLPAGIGGGYAAAQDQNAAAPTTPQRVETTVYNAWTVTCRDLEDKKNDCAAMLRVADKDSGNIVLVWVVGKDQANKLTSVIQTPTGVQLAPGVSLKVGSAAARKLAYTACSPNQCDATLPADAPFVKEVTAGAEATATITLIDGRTAEFKFPLDGSAAALKRVAGS